MRDRTPPGSGDDARDPRYSRTAGRLGYGLWDPVEETRISRRKQKRFRGRPPTRRLPHRGKDPSPRPRGGNRGEFFWQQQEWDAVLADGTPAHASANADETSALSMTLNLKDAGICVRRSNCTPVT